MAIIKVTRLTIKVLPVLNYTKSEHRVCTSAISAPILVVDSVLWLHFMSIAPAPALSSLPTEQSTLDEDDGLCSNLISTTGLEQFNSVILTSANDNLFEFLLPSTATLDACTLDACTLFAGFLVFIISAHHAPLDDGSTTERFSLKSSRNWAGITASQS